MEALRQTGGRVTEAAVKLGIGRRTFYDLMARHPEVAEVVEEERELLLDKSEGVVANLVRNKKDFKAAVFVLRTQGRKRGWVERQELAGADGEPLGFQLVLLDPRPLSDDPFADLVEPPPPSALPARSPQPPSADPFTGLVEPVPAARPRG